MGSCIRIFSATSLALTVAAAGVGCANTNFAGALIDAGAKVADTVAVQVPFLIRPRSADAGALRSMVVVPASAQGSPQIANAVESSMIKLRISEQPYYATVKLESPRGQIAEPQLAMLGRQGGAQGALGIGPVAVDAKTTAVQEDRASCAVETKKLFQACPTGKMVNRKITCQQTQTTAAAGVRMVRSADGRTVFSDTLVGSAQAKACPNEAAVPDRNELIGMAMADLATQVMKTMAPSIELRPLDLKTADARLPDAKRKPFDAAFEFARAKRLDEACTRFGELYDDFKESVALTYNVAFCHESRGDLLRANQAYRRASELESGPDSQIERRLASVERALKENPIAFATSSPGPEGAPATAAGAGRVPAGNKRVALVVGNARYQTKALVNPINDARLIAQRLKAIGFDVTTVENVDSARFASATRDFANRAARADVALFYYAGHAIQHEGDSVMMPVDNARMRTPEDVREQGGVALASLLAYLDQARPTIRLVVLDACRDNPLPASTRSVGGDGLAPLPVPAQGTLIAYATGPGKAAEDGTGKNSVFSKHLASTITLSDLSIEDVFKRVRQGVMKETGNRQEPMERNSLIGDVVLVRK